MGGNEPLSYRTFVAIELPDAAREAMEALQERLRRDLGEDLGARAFRWLRPENLHLTLHFLGEVEPARIPQLAQAVEQAAREHGPFDLEARGVDCFPSPRQPRVAWAGFAPAAQPGAVHASLGGELRKRRFPVEKRPYTPHLTLAYAQKRAAWRELRQAGERLAALEVGTIARFRVDALTLMRSDLQPGGPIYTPLGRAPLAGV